MKPFVSFGELDNTRSGRVKELQEIFPSLGGLDVDVPPDIHVAMWDKFIFICSTSGVGAVTRQPMGVFRSVPESRAMLESAVREVEEIGRKKGVAMPEDLIETLMKRIDGLPAGMVASMQKDIMEGRLSELEAQTGAVVRMGRALEVPTPTHTFIYASLLPMEKAAGSA
jgi:2-dehydropantoate 2-reductase